MIREHIFITVGMIYLWTYKNIIVYKTESIWMFQWMAKLSLLQSQKLMEETLNFDRKINLHLQQLGFLSSIQIKAFTMRDSEVKILNCAHLCGILQKVFFFEKNHNDDKDGMLFPSVILVYGKAVGDRHFLIFTVFCPVIFKTPSVSNQ